MENKKKIKRFSLSFIWTRTFFNFLQSDSEEELNNLPFNFFIKLSSYKEKYRTLKQKGFDDNGLSLPWKKTHVNWFWEYYFEGRDPWDVSPNLAWERYMIPFRKPVPVKISSPILKPQGSVSIEGFFYRHGIALVITVRLFDSPSLTALLNKAFQVRRSKIFELTNGELSPGKYSLTSLANKLLDSFCSLALGAKGSKGRSFPGEPFSVSTVIQGDEYYRDIPVDHGGDIHKVLEGLTNWNRNWQRANPPKLEDKKIPIQNDYDNHCLYADKQGRVVWFPWLFTPSSSDNSKQYALGWYKRNLVLASLQVASIGAFVKYTAGLKKNGTDINTYHRQWAEYAMRILKRLYSGENTYKTWSARAYIEQNGIMDDLKYLEETL